MIKILKNLRGKDWAWLAVGVGFIVLQVWLDLKLPTYMGKITDLLTSGNADMGKIWANGGYMIACALGSLGAAIIVGYIVARVGASFSQKVRFKMFEKVDSFSMAEINRFSTTSLITRTTNDVTQVQMLITMGLQFLIKAPILAIWAIVLISGRGFEFTLVTGVAVLVLIIMFLVVAFVLIPKFRKMQVLTDNMTKVARENLTGLPVVHAYNAENFQQQKFEKANAELTHAHLFTSRGMAFLMPVISLLMTGLPLAIYWIGAALINGTSNVAEVGPIFSDIIVFISYGMQIVMAFMLIAFMFIMLPRASVSAKRINEVLETQPSVIGGIVKEGHEGRTGEVVFNNVSFKYPGAADYVIKDVSFNAKKGETVAFIGSTGSGKSTLINLVPRFYDTTGGEILIDGVAIKDYDLETLRNKIGYISQKAVLFSGSVTDNVAFGENGREQATEKDVKEAVKIAQGTDFVEKMKNQYEADVARGGTNLSGGQKQRLAIARAIARKPEIFIFDDSFSALDYKTDRTLRTALKNQIKDATSLIVAQRIGTIMDADKIVVLDQGRVVGIGKHKELLKNCKVYKEIAASQLSEEELALGGVK